MVRVPQGLIEHSHRDVGGPVQTCMSNVCDLLRDLLDIPDNYHVLLMQGGAHGQFAGNGYRTIQVEVGTEMMDFRVLMGTSPEEVAQWRAELRSRPPLTRGAARWRTSTAKISSGRRGCG